MFLTKSCNKKYNIKAGSLKLGTLYEYRETEIEQIADKYEGTLEFRLRFKGIVKIPTKWFNLMCGGTFHYGSEPVVRFPGQMRSRFDVMQMRGSNDEFITLEDSYAVLNREALNSFVYCMSHVEKPDDCKGMFPDYDDYWHINDKDRNDFAVEVSEILLDKIKSEYRAGNYIVPKGTDIDNLLIYVKVGLVYYVPRSLEITQANSLSIDEFFKKMADMTFIKPPHPFEREKEYRIELALVCGDRYIEPLVKSLIIDSERLQRFVI